VIYGPSVHRTRTEARFSRRRFALRRTETRVRNAFRLGREIDLRPREANGTPGKRRLVVRAAVIAAMLCGDHRPGTKPRLVLRGANITGPLDLSYARIEHPIILRECDLDAPIDVTEARLSGLTLDGDVAADLTNAHVRTLTITGEPPTGLLDLTNAKADVFRDNPERWRDQGSIVLNGFEYTAIHMDRVQLKDRYRWLSRGVRETQAKTGGYYEPGPPARSLTSGRSLSATQSWSSRIPHWGWNW
jgi:hypothetical protein